MKNILKNRLALSTVVTTLIILVVSVLLAGVVTYYAINVTSTRVQEEALSLSWQHVWVDDDGASVAAIMVTNTGGRDVVINKVAVRGQECSTLTVASVASNATGTDLTYTASPAGEDSCPVTLSAGTTVSIYITSPDSISTQDIGLTVGFSVFTSQAMYYKEVNVQAAPAA
ncbi:MAG: hypothetical protein NWF01_03290 [Candidatus Bathyarchaeota archaeon]|nr:hypothetical protein [Candidatus Bathyarchaeota archaeon]